MTVAQTSVTKIVASFFVLNFALVSIRTYAVRVRGGGGGDNNKLEFQDYCSIALRLRSRSDLKKNRPVMWDLA